MIQRPNVFMPFFPYLTTTADLQYIYKVWSLGNTLEDSVSNTTSKLLSPETLIP